jgi:hypothetical protein
MSKVTVPFPIPEWAINTLTKCGYTQEQIVKIFYAFLQELVQDVYGQTATDFDNWVNDEGFEEILEFNEII